MRKTAFYILLLLLAGGAAWLATRYFRHAPKVAPATPEEPLAVMPMATAISSSSPIQLPDTELKRPPGLDDEKWRGLQLIWRRLKEENQPIEFYLRVIDQDGQPVSGAVLATELTRTDEEKLKPENFLRFRPGEEVVTERLKLTSDGQGWIRFKGTGRYVFLGSGTLSKEGYLWDLPPTLGTLIYEPGKRRATVSVEMHNAFDPKKGYTLHLWKERPTEALVPFHFGVPVDFEGTNWYAVDFFRGVITNGMAGDFRFWFLTTNDAKGNPARLFRFEARQGGLQLDQNPYPYEAPSDGYLPMLEWMYEPYGQHTRERQDALIKRFYMHSRDGRIHAALTWNFSAGGGADIRGVLNPTSSRNLSPDPAKQITDPEEIRRLDESTRAK